MSGTVADVCRVFVVTVDTKTTSHSYHNQGSSKAFLIDGEENPVIELEVGCTYVFDQSHDSNTGHPLGLYRDPTKLSECTVGVSTDADGMLTITVTDDTPSRLYYQCKNHAYMGSAVIKVGSGLGASDSNCNNLTTASAYGQIMSVKTGVSCADCKCNDGESKLWKLSSGSSNTDTGTCTCFS